MAMHKLHKRNVHDLPVHKNIGLLLAAVIMQARMDCDEVNRNRDYYTRKSKRTPSEELLLSYDSLKWWINEPGIIEAFASWQNEIQPEAIREELRRALG